MARFVVEVVVTSMQTTRRPRSHRSRMLVEAPDGERFGYTVFPDSTDDDLRCQLAERIPEYLPELTVTWAGVFPPCPGHVHPAEAGLDEREQRGYWRCPRDGRRLAPIGALRDARHASR